MTIELTRITAKRTPSGLCYALYRSPDNEYEPPERTVLRPEISAPSYELGMVRETPAAELSQGIRGVLEGNERMILGKSPRDRLAFAPSAGPITHHRTLP